MITLQGMAGPYKRAYIAAVWQAKFYLPRQAAAAAEHKLQYTSRNVVAHVLRLVYCGCGCRSR